MFIKRLKFYPKGIHILKNFSLRNYKGVNLHNIKKAINFKFQHLIESSQSMISKFKLGKGKRKEYPI